MTHIDSGHYIENNNLSVNQLSTIESASIASDNGENRKRHVILLNAAASQEFAYRLVYKKHGEEKNVCCSDNSALC